MKNIDYEDEEYEKKPSKKKKTAEDLFASAAGAYTFALAISALALAVLLVSFFTNMGRAGSSAYLGGAAGAFLACLYFKAKANHEDGMSRLAKDVKQIKDDALDRTLYETRKEDR